MYFAWKYEHIEAFLEMYRIHECLWNNKSENYHKTNISEKTYKALHIGLNVPQLSVNDVRGKIKNNLRAKLVSRWCRPSVSED
jgi:hypothetical protein